MEEKDYVTYEVAKILKEKGYIGTFDESCWRYGNDGKMYWFSRIGAYETVDKVEKYYQRPNVQYPCPSLYEAQKWLREKYQIHLDVSIYAEFGWACDVSDISTNEFKCLDFIEKANSYEEALNAGVKKAMDFI